MPLFAKTPYRVVHPEPRVDTLSKLLVQDPPYRVYLPRDEDELYQMWKQKDADLIEVTESHAHQVLRKQKGYQEVPVEKFEAAAVRKTIAARRKRASVASKGKSVSE